MASLFESYNARFVDLRTVANTFVSRQNEFAKLREHNHSILIGPRGSGKTTLLKMLKIGAQLAWPGLDETGKSAPLSFAAIYVGADRQLDLLIDDGNGDPSQLKSLLSRSLLSIRVKFACLDTLSELTNDNLSESPLQHLFRRKSKDEISEISQLLARAWRAEASASPLELRLALRRQISDLNLVVETYASALNQTREDLLGRHPLLADDPIEVCSAFIDVVNTYFEDPDMKWALCIDELEILPAHLQQHLFNALRSKDQRLLLKYATSPFSGLSWDRTISNRPMEGHDFTPVNLTYGSKREARRFSAKILDSMVQSEMRLSGRTTGPKQPRAIDILGRSPIAEANTDAAQRNSYASGGVHYKRFARLLEVDVAFRQFAEDRGIDLNADSRGSESRRASMLRKYIWPVAIRLEYGPLNEFRQKDLSTGMRPPSRKAMPKVYLGYDSLMTMCEGNPRTTIGLFRPMLRRSGANGRVEDSIQSEMLQDTIAKYVSLLSAIRLDRPGTTDGAASVVALLDDIGRMFSAEVNGPTFKSEPTLSMKVDKPALQKYENALGLALNQGALVMISDGSDSMGFGGLLGARLRLSYLLCPRYHLPLITGQDANLSNILTISSRSKQRSLSFGDLFELGDEDA